jgi:hypothetical protein
MTEAVVAEALDTSQSGGSGTPWVGISLTTCPDTRNLRLLGPALALTTSAAVASGPGGKFWGTRSLTKPSTVSGGQNRANDRK